MRILVTGATGVIGKRVVPLLVQAGHSVTALGRTPEKRDGLKRAGATPVEADLFDPASVRRMVQGHGTVINLATHMPPTARMIFRGAWRENDRIRSIASKNLVDAAFAAGVTRFIQESFALIYPDRGSEWIGEDTPLQPVPYNRTILDAEREAGRFKDEGGAGVVLRFAGFYGPDSPALHDIIGLVRKGWAPVPGPEEAYFSSISHDGAASAVMAALSARAGTYNVVDDEPVTKREYFDLLAKALGVRPPKIPPKWTRFLFGAPGEMLTRSIRMSNRKLRDETGWKPAYPSVREGWNSLPLSINGEGAGG